MHKNINGIESARLASLAERLPLQYGLAFSMMFLKIVVFAGTAPWWLVTVPVMFCMLFMMRGIKWSRVKISVVPEDVAAGVIRHSSKLVIFGAIVFISLDSALYSYGNEIQRTFVLIQLLMGCVCQLFYFVYMPRASAVTSAMFVVAVLILTIASGETSLMAITATTLMVLVCLAHVVYSHNRDFVELVRSHNQMKTLGEENERLASTDALTGLPNRREFFKGLAAASKRFAETGETFAIGIVDLDGFKAANDTFGHKVGDVVLGTTAARMQAVADGHAKVYRLGGDEFAFVTDAPMERSQLSLLAEAMITSVSEPMTHNAATVKVGCSVGIAQFPVCTYDSSMLYELADDALYESKHRGRGCVTICEASKQVLSQPIPLAS